ncbi:MAG: 50S ribosomal protein L25/general stress protein Ctc [Leptolyngbyaceae cyanobacterium CRU_2_3]|nr:50S ribosomal protein L25/general stress protein Ctc [Leptolyngbyaceae cyanobacterium CRU_2_3]
MELTVECNKRSEGSKPNALRREGKIPAVLYGHKGTESMSLTVDAKSAEILVRRSSLNNTLIQVNVPDLGWSGKALLREVQSHPWKRFLYHLSFFSVSSTDKIEVTVPIHFVGVAIGAKQDGGSMDTVLNELEVACTGGTIPDGIEVDVSNMNIGDAIHVNELVLPTGVTAVGEGDRVVVSILGKASKAEDGTDAE